MICFPWHRKLQFNEISSFAEPTVNADEPYDDGDDGQNWESRFERTLLGHCRQFQVVVVDNASRFHEVGRKRLEEAETSLEQFVFLLVVLHLMVALIEEVKLLVGSQLVIDELLGVLEVDDGILLAVEDDDREGEGIHLLPDEAERLEDGLGHFDAHEGNHESVLEDVVHVLVVLGQRSGVYHRVYDQILQLVPQLLHNPQLHLRNPSVLRHSQQRTREDAPRHLQQRPVQQQLNCGKSSQRVRVHVQGQFGSCLSQQRDDVIFQYFEGSAAPRSSGVAEASEVHQQNLELMDGEEVGDVVEASGVLSEAMNNCDGAFGAGGRELGVVEPHVSQFGIQVQLAHHVLLLLELPQKIVTQHLLYPIHPKISKRSQWETKLSGISHLPLRCSEVAYCRKAVKRSQSVDLRRGGLKASSAPTRKCEGSPLMVGQLEKTSTRGVVLDFSTCSF